MNDLAALRARVTAHGWYRRAPGRVLGELACHLLLACGGSVAFFLCDHFLLRVLALLVSVGGSIGVGTNTHTSSHYATSNRRWVNEALTYLGHPLFLQLSATYWWHKHTVRHHPNPNLVGVDTDIDFSPWFALTDREVAHSSGRRRAYYRLQWLVVPFAIAANGPNVYAYSWRHVLRRLGDARQRKLMHWLDLSLLLLHWAIWVGLPLAFYPAADVLGFYGVRLILLGYAFFCILAPGHFPAEAVCLEPTPGTRRGDFCLRQTVATVNFCTGRIGRFLCSGLEYQIEHHLFPGVSHVFYPKMSRLVEAFCRERGYPYRTLGWLEAIHKSFLVFRRPKQVVSQLEISRPAP